MSNISRINSPVPAYEPNPTLFPQSDAPVPVAQGTAVYGTAPGQQQQQQQHVGTPPINYTEKSSSVTENKYTQPDHVSPLASPVQQPQNTPFGKQEYYGSQQQLPQQQLPPQQLQQQQQQQQFAPQQQQQQQQQPPQQMYQTAVNLANLQEAPAPVDCPVCRHRALTVVDMHAGNTTHAWAALTCFFCLLGCIPYLIPSLKDVQHKCGHCGVALAQWHRSGRTVVLQHA